MNISKNRNHIRTYSVWNKYHPNDLMPQKGYVIHHINEKCDDDSPSNLQKMTNKEHMRIHHLGKSLSIEHKKKLSEANKGRHHSEETKQKLSKFKGELHHHFGKKSPIEWCQKMSISMMGKNAGEKSAAAKLKEKEVIEIREKYKTGNYLQKELANIYGVKPPNINCILHNKSWINIGG